MTPDNVYNAAILWLGLGLMSVSLLLWRNCVRPMYIRTYFDVFFAAILAVVASTGFYLVLTMLVKFYTRIWS